jgi:ferrous iron transport protein B
VLKVATTSALDPLVLVGGESAGKSTLVAALASRRPRAENLPGSTVAVEVVDGADRRIVDTPGILHGLDTATTTTALRCLDEHTTGDVLLVLRATQLDQELAELLPSVAGRRGAVAVTHWDLVDDTPAARHALAAVAAATGVPFVPIDTRNALATRAALRPALARPGRFAGGPVLARVGWRVEPPPTLLEHRVLGPLLGLLLLLAPAVAAVWFAVTLAGLVEPGVQSALAPVAERAQRLPFPLEHAVGGEYGLLTMGPLLLVWAAPVAVVLALLLGILRASGLLDRLTTAVHPLVRPFGLTGRDLVRVVAGHGCNVPAVVATRSCSSCTRDATIAAIGFGSACSYQLAATLGVLAAAQRPTLVVPYLLVLHGGALLHARSIGRGQGVRAPHLDLALLQGRAFLRRPRWREVRRDAATTLSHATVRALPVFLGVVLLASLLAAFGILDAAGSALSPLMGALRLPADVALPVAVASVRKDGLLLLAEPGTVAALDGAQLLAALVLAGALLPCLVTGVTVARERGPGVAARLLTRQAGSALLLAAAISWAGVVAP